MRIKDFISQDCIKINLENTGRDEHIFEMFNILEGAGEINIYQAKEFADRIIKREKMGSTGIGQGVAIPYLREKSLERTVGALGISNKGIDFNSSDGKPVYISVLCLNKNVHEQLKALSTVSFFLKEDYNRRRLRSAKTVSKVYKIIEKSWEI